MEATTHNISAHAGKCMPNGIASDMGLEGMLPQLEETILRQLILSSKVSKRVKMKDSELLRFPNLMKSNYDESKAPKPNGLFRPRSAWTRLPLRVC